MKRKEGSSDEVRSEADAPLTCLGMRLGACLLADAAIGQRFCWCWLGRSRQQRLKTAIAEQLPLTFLSSLPTQQHHRTHLHSYHRSAPSSSAPLSSPRYPQTQWPPTRPRPRPAASSWTPSSRASSRRSPRSCPASPCTRASLLPAPSAVRSPTVVSRPSMCKPHPSS